MEICAVCVKRKRKHVYRKISHLVVCTPETSQGVHTFICLMFSRPRLVGTRALQDTVGISVLNFNLYRAVSSSAHTRCYNYIWATGSAVFHLARTGHAPPLQALALRSGPDAKEAGMSCDHMMKASQAGHSPGCNSTKKILPS